MLNVKTYLHQSDIQGIGLFAAEFIPEGTLIWRFSPGLDMSFTPAEYGTLANIEEFKPVLKYIYKSLSSGNYVLCTDDARFINHHKRPNTLDVTGDNEGVTIAARDIEAGEEITSDYAAFDADFARYAAELEGAHEPGIGLRGY